jgi:hypothetical protein
VRKHLKRIIKKKNIIILVSLLVAGILISGYVFIFMNPYLGTEKDTIISKPLDEVLSKIAVQSFRK